MPPRSVGYILAFAAAVSLVCGVLVSAAAVTLKERQQANAELERKTNVLLAAGLARSDERITREEVEQRFAGVRAVVIDLETGAEVEGVDPATFDPQKAKADPELGRAAPANTAGVKRLPRRAVIYHVLDEHGETRMVVLPIEGLGLWSTLYGFVALDADLDTVRGLTYYQHGETPGLGGEVDNPRWKALWPGRRAFGPGGDPVIQVIKGSAGPADQDPHRVDGLSGATITSRGVTNMLHFWLGANGYGPLLERLREESAAATAALDAAPEQERRNS
ncbi:MAG TPA: Na(+)-translocating NADH-quinone reductase subunit C [Thermoanaerobaculia bacterium]|nr:Na(+)-translocating NADH-quinone reductase subunit C [Thermoanaerobaculia bacterium]